MTSPTRNTEPENELWLICPICKEPNPYGTLHCQHCWGASLYSIQPVTSQELAKITRRKLLRQKRLNTLRIFTISLVSPLLLSTTVFLGLYSFTDVVFRPPATVNSSSLPGKWTMFHRDLGHTGSTSLRGTTPQGTQKWAFPTGGPIHSSPAIANGTVYVGSRDWKLYALDAETGTKRWEFKAESWIESSPIVANGVVYFGSNDGRFYALDAETGERLWYFKTKYAVKSSPAIANGIVYFGGDDYYVYALDAVTGTKIWDFETGSHVSSAPIVANGIVYIGSMDSICYGLHSQNGRYRLGFKTFQPVIGSPAVNNGAVYANAGGFLYAIDGDARNWPGEHDFRGWWLQFYAFRLAPPPPPISGYMWRLRLGRTSPASPTVTDGTVYTSSDNRIYRIDTQTRKIQWWSPLGDAIRSSPALGNNVIYVGSDDGRLYALDATTGKKIWDFPTGGKITSSPAVSGDTIYVGSHDGKLYAIE